MDETVQELKVGDTITIGQDKTLGTIAEIRPREGEQSWERDARRVRVVWEDGFEGDRSWWYAWELTMLAEEQ